MRAIAAIRDSQYGGLQRAERFSMNVDSNYISVIRLWATLKLTSGISFLQESNVLWGLLEEA